jgi:hypothetical protein
MADYTVLSWQNEHALEAFPLEAPFELENFLVDASFVQFDGFIPILRKIVVASEEIVITLVFDEGEVSATYAKSSNNYFLRFYGVDNRYLGTVTFGAGLQLLWAGYVGQKLERNIKFLPHLVRSIPLKDAVYTFDSLYGDITLDSATDSTAVMVLPNAQAQTLLTGKTVFYNLESSRSLITFNAVKNHGLYSTADTLKPLKKINLVAPVANNIYLSSNDIIKFTSFNNKRLNVSLVGESSGGSIVPTLAA